MKSFPTTSASLIARIRDPENVDAWNDFESLYRPVVFRLARSKGLQYADALDLVQQVLISVAAAIPRYEAIDQGPPFRNWLSRIVRNAILKALTRRPKESARGGTNIIDVLSEFDGPDRKNETLIRLELRREIFRQAAEKVRSDVQPISWNAFEITVIQGQSIEQAAKKLNMSIGNVYAARSRLMKRLRDAVRQLEVFQADH